MAERKTWAVLHYLVAVTGDEPAKGDPDADERLRKTADEEINAIVAAARALLPTMHVAFQVEHWTVGNDGKPRQPRAARRVKVTPVTDAPIEEKVAPLIAANGHARRADDLQAFFDWTQKPASPGHSPADHIAVFFWGHSAGPAGIFDLVDGSEPAAPTLLQSAASFMFDKLGTMRGGRAGQFFATVALPQLTGAFTAFGEQQCDLVVFKDCWMSTGEVACELAGHVSAVIGSQSQVPIQGVWPYGILYQSLADLPTTTGPTAAAGFKPFFETFVSLYKDKETRGPLTATSPPEPSFPSVPFSLLDLDKALAIRGPLGALVAAIRKSSLTSEQQACKKRIFDEASTGFLPKFAGDIALVDVLRLCNGLEQCGVAVPQAKAVKNAVEQIVVISDSVPGAPNCRGFSLFYHPSPERIAQTPDETVTAAGAFENKFVMNAVDANAYSNLRLNKGLLESWFDIAFEQIT